MKNFAQTYTEFSNPPHISAQIHAFYRQIPQIYGTAHTLIKKILHHLISTSLICRFIERMKRNQTLIFAEILDQYNVDSKCVSIIS